MPAKANSRLIAPVRKRIFLTGTKGHGYRVLIKDNIADVTIDTIEAPSYPAGRAIVKALRDLDQQRGTIW